MFLPINVEAHYVARRQFPFVVYTILLIMTCLHFYLALYVDESARLSFYYRFGISKYDYHWWSAFTCTLIHGSWIHLIGNGYFLWIYGRSIEKKLGRLKFIVIYLSGAYISVNLHVLTLSPLFIDEPVIGASGAISAVLGAFLVLFPKAKLATLYFNIISFRPILIDLPAFVVLGLWFLGQLLFTLQLMGDFHGIAFWAHIGGFFAGAGVGTLFSELIIRKEKSEDLHCRTGLLSAWLAIRCGDHSLAATHAQQLDDKPIRGDQGLQRLFKAIIYARHREDAAAALVEFQTAFRQSRDYLDPAKQVTIYLQMLKVFQIADIPAAIHRDAGFAAAAMKQHELALWSFQKAIAGGIDQRVDQMLLSITGILNGKMNQPALAIEIKSLKTQ